MTAPDPRVGEIEARLTGITPGPWKTVRHDLSLYVEAESGELNPINLGYVGNRPENDAEFIANAPADVAYLLAELRKAHEALGVAFDYGWREGKGIPTPCDTLTGELFHDEAATAKFNPYRAAVAAAKGDEQ